MSTNFWWITLGCILFAAFIVVFSLCVQSSRYEEEDIGPIKDTYHGEDKDANS
jgi:hypothetical protein